MDVDPKQIKWERLKKPGYAPSLRSGCTMALWQARNMGIMFGGVYDEDKGEEGMESVFYNDLFVLCSLLLLILSLIEKFR